MVEDAFLHMDGIYKEFPGVVANDHVDFAVRPGEIHGLLGQNGAGKSTLMKILYGLYSADEGEIRLRDETLDLNSPKDAIGVGIGMVHQHFKLIPRLSVTENVILGEREPAGAYLDDGDGWLPPAVRRNRLVRGLASRFSVGRSRPQERIRALADRYGFDVDPTAYIWQLDVGQQQRVEILKALYRDADLLILDEPTAVLSPAEAERLFDALRELTAEGISIIFITHKLKEVKAITDRVTVLREGENVGTVETADVTRAELAEMMVGREVLFQIEKESATVGDPVLEVSGLRAEDERGIEALTGTSMTVHEGEIVGIAGVSGNGQKELAESLAGIRRPEAGRIVVGGDDLSDARPREFIDNGVSFVPEDRLRYGCAEDLSVMHNATMKEFRDETFGDGKLIHYDELRRFVRDRSFSKFCDIFGDGYALRYDELREYAETLVEEFDVRGVHDVTEATAGDLSGGNLQKLILAREIYRDPDLLVANQPTRGVDVGAIEFIREAIIEQRKRGTGVVFFSEDLDEIIDVSDRVLVLYEGEFVHETAAAEADRERIGLEMTGGGPGGEALADGSTGAERGES